MNKINTQLPSRQRGSFYVTVFMLVLMGAAVTFGLKVAPAYAGNAILKSSMTVIMAKKEYKDMDIDAIRKDLGKTLQVNKVEGLSLQDIVIKREGGKEYVDINYEIRNPLVLNISVVVAFQNRFDKN